MFWFSPAVIPGFDLESQSQMTWKLLGKNNANFHLKH